MAFRFSVRYFQAGLPVCPILVLGCKGSSPASESGFNRPPGDSLGSLLIVTPALHGACSRQSCPSIMKAEGRVPCYSWSITAEELPSAFRPGPARSASFRSPD